MRRAPALRLIIAYKLGRAALSLLGAIAALVLVLLGLAPHLHDAAEAVHHHAVSALALRLSALLVSAAAPGHLLVVAGALALDGAVLLLEGWALWRGWTWGPWLVVAASGLLLPFEVVALAHHPAVGRVLVLVINAAIVAWLVRHALHLHRTPGSG